MLGFVLQRFEPIGWAEEILAAATAADLPQLPRLYTAAGVCCVHRTARGRRRLRPDARSALQADPRYDPFDPAGAARGRGRRPSIRGPATRPLRWRSAPTWPPSPGSPTSSVCAALLYVLPAVGRAERGQGDRRRGRGRRPRPRQPGLDRLRAHRVRAGLRRHRPRPRPRRLAPGARLRPRAPARGSSRRTSLGTPASLEAAHGDLDQALELFDTAIDAFHRAGNHGDLARRARRPGRVLRPHRATRDRRHHLRHQHPLRRHSTWSSTFRRRRDHVRAVLGETVFDRVCRRRGGHGTRRRRRLRPRPDPSRSPPNRGRHLTAHPLGPGIAVGCGHLGSKPSSPRPAARSDRKLRENSACQPSGARFPSSSSIEQTVHDQGQPVHLSAPKRTDLHSISVRDAEVAGSNPAFPTKSKAGHLGDVRTLWRRGGWAAVGDGDVSVHRRGGVDRAVGARARRARAAGTRRAGRNGAGAGSGGRGRQQRGCRFHSSGRVPRGDRR